MRTITLLIVHCSAVMPDVESGAADIDRWHRAQGWRGGIGYHYVVRRDGTVEPGRREEVPGAHCRHHNAHSIGICYIGGLAADGRTSKDTRTPAQRKALKELLGKLHRQFPKALIVGHHDLNPTKSCPCFDVHKEGYP